MVLMCTWQRRKCFGELPPGPTPLPFIGNYSLLDTEHLCTSIVKRALQPRVHHAPGVMVLCGYDAVKAALLDQAEDFSGRGEQATFDWIFENHVMRWLPGPQQQAFQKLKGLKNFIVKKVEQNQRTPDPNAPRKFIDSFLICMQEGKNNPNSKFFLKNLVMTMLNLFIAGTETVSTTLRYGFLLFMKHPDVEAKVHEEIDRVIGRNRQPKFEDRLKMPYTEAVIHDIQRFGNIIPMGLAHRVTKDTNFRGFLIPKGTEVFPMLGSVLRDPKFFSNPGDFTPQHFLNEKGQFKKSDAFVPFSIGKRYCFGEGLARMELFFFFVTVMQNFGFRSQQRPQDIDVSPQYVGFATIPRKYTMSFLPR
ncbi:cytochrome P450 2A13-like [Erethizon dorsatum]